jgi:hypothetical protein
MTATSDDIATSRAASALDAERFHREGWAGPFTLFADDRADGIRRMCDEIIADDSDLVSGRSGARIHNGHLRDRRLLDLALAPQLVEQVCGLLGDDAQLWRSHFWNKLPGAKAVPWHQDHNYWPLEPAVIVSAWIAIDRSTRENACLHLIPGSHRAILPHVASTDGSAFVTLGDPALVPRERALPIELEVDRVSTTQDVAVAIAFLVTEIVEYAMLQGSAGPVEITLRRTSPLTGKLTIANQVLLAPDGDGETAPPVARKQFERIIEGLARQLRSPLDRRLGRYSVDLPLFPER